MKTMSAALAATGLLAALAVATTATARDREHVSVSVSTAGLNLNDPRDVEKLRARTAEAIALACNPGDRLNADYKPDWQCRREMSFSVNGKLQAIALRTANNVASN